MLTFRWRPLLGCAVLWALSDLLLIALSRSHAFDGMLGAVSALFVLVVVPAAWVFALFYLIGEYDIRSQLGIAGLLLVALMLYYGNVSFLVG